MNFLPIVIAFLILIFNVNFLFAADKPIVVLETTQGNIEIELFPEIAPKAVENFIGLINKKFYDGIIFHRVIKSFMVQTGDPTGTGRGGDSIWGKPFKNEVSENLKFNKQGLLAMANRGPDTNTSQFFITTINDASWLNMKYTIFGQVISGYDAVQKIENIQTDASDRPLQEQKIIKAYVKDMGVLSYGAENKVTASTETAKEISTGDAGNIEETRIQKSDMLLIDGMGYFKLLDLLDDYNANIKVELDKSTNEKMVRLNLKEGYVLFRQDSDTVVINGVVRKMNKPFIEENGELMIPLEVLLTQAFSDASGYITKWTNDESYLDINAKEN